MAFFSLALLAFLIFWFKWKRRKTITEEGYVYLVAHKKSEHRYVAEKCLRRALTSLEIVHHINGNKQDNSPGNLCIMSEAEHERFHSWINQKRREDGHYPGMTFQKRILVERYGGRLLK